MDATRDHTIVDTSMSADELSQALSRWTRSIGSKLITTQARVFRDAELDLTVTLYAGPGHPLPISVPDEIDATSVRIEWPADSSIAAAAAATLAEHLRCSALPFSASELAAIDNSLPLLREVSSKPSMSEVFAGWAVIWRDHFVEDTLAAVLAFVHLGVPPEWIMALDKGDSTAKPQRIRATLRARGIAVGLFDNNPEMSLSGRVESEQTRVEIEAFVDRAHKSGRKVLVVDDGLIVLDCFADDQRRVDAVVELTISGLKRLNALSSIDVPVYDLATSEVKRTLIYPEIATSCVRRIQELTDRSLAGQSVLLVGYGALGQLIAEQLRSAGATVRVTDIKPIALDSAQQHSFTTSRTVLEALAVSQPDLIIGCAGEPWLTWEAVDALPDGAVVAAIATKDLSCLAGQPPAHWSAHPLPDIGTQWIGRGKSFRQLGEGRSINLYHSEAVPNSEIDVFKAACVVAAHDLCSNHAKLKPAIYRDEVNRAIDAAGLYEKDHDRRQRRRPSFGQGLLAACMRSSTWLYETLGKGLFLEANGLCILASGLTLTTIVLTGPVDGVPAAEVPVARR